MACTAAHHQGEDPDVFLFWRPLWSSIFLIVNGLNMHVCLHFSRLLHNKSTS